MAVLFYNIGKGVYSCYLCSPYILVGIRNL